MVFDRLWKTMKERGVSQYKLIKEYKISTGQLDRLRKNENVNTYTLDQLCRILNCGLGRYRGIQRKLKPEGSAFRGIPLPRQLHKAPRSVFFGKLHPVPLPVFPVVFGDQTGNLSLGQLHLFFEGTGRHPKRAMSQNDQLLQIV